MTSFENQQYTEKPFIFSISHSSTNNAISTLQRHVFDIKLSLLNENHIKLKHPWWRFKTTTGSIHYSGIFLKELHCSSVSTELYHRCTFWLIQQYYISYLILHTVKHLYQVCITQTRKESTPQAHATINSEDKPLSWSWFPAIKHRVWPRASLFCAKQADSSVELSWSE